MHELSQNWSGVQYPHKAIPRFTLLPYFKLITTEQKTKHNKNQTSDKKSLFTYRWSS